MSNEPRVSVAQSAVNPRQELLDESICSSVYGAQLHSYHPRIVAGSRAFIIRRQPASVPSRSRGS